MKRRIAMMLSLVMAIGGAGTWTVQAEEGQNGEIVEVFWQYPAYGEVSEGFYAVEDALNEMMEKDIGVHVTFVPTGLETSQQDAILDVSAGVQLDVCLSAFTSVGTLVEKGLILPLDDMLEANGWGEVLAEHSANPYEKSTFNGSVYGVPTGDTTYHYYSYVLKKKYAEKYDVMPDDNKIYTLDEMEDIMAVIKEGEGENVYTHIPWLNTYEPLNYGLCEYDKLGGDLSYGALMLNRGFDQTEIVNFFATEEYAEYCNRMYDWAQKGYISPNAAIDADAVNEIGSSDKYVGWFGYGDATLDMLNNAWNDDVVQYKTVDGYIGSTSAAVNWSIPITSGNPEKALEALVYIYENPKAAWLIQFGIEGDSWRITEEKDGSYAGEYTNEDVFQLSYLNPYGIWGNVLEWPAIGTAIGRGAMKMECDQKIREEGRLTPSAGYVFDAAAVSAEVAAVQTVIAQYAPSLNAGTLDPSKSLPEFLEALDVAGINKIIAENQSQFDAWLADK